MNTDHLVGGGLATIAATNLPPVLAYFQGGAAPVNPETALVILVGAAVVSAVRWWLNRGETAAAPVS